MEKDQSKCLRGPKGTEVRGHRGEGGHRGVRGTGVRGVTGVMGKPGWGGAPGWGVSRRGEGRGGVGVGWGGMHRLPYSD